MLTSSSTDLIGRDRQRRRLREAERSGRPELIAVFGRRRVGKTFLIRQHFAGRLRFELTGTRDATLQEQLANFARALGRLTGFQHARPISWQEAFFELELVLEHTLRKRGRHVLFFDELPWLARRNSRFLPAFEQFWNHWASRHPQLIVVICGSSASWMIRKVLRQRGGLHNRVTRRVRLLPFTLAETETYLRSSGIRWKRPAIAEAYMALGGVPFYLSLIPRGRSPAQAIDELTRGGDAELRHEFDQLYAALFDHYEVHLAVVRELGKQHGGLTRKALIAATGLTSGGGLSRVLDELEACGFIRSDIPFGKTRRDVMYRLMDEFTLFHLRWGRRRTRWTDVRGKPAWRAWSGYAFENLCLRHVDGIREVLGLAKIEAEATSWRWAGTAKTEGAQIDLVIDRDDDAVNLCEIKFTDKPFRVTKSVAADLERKRRVFEARTGTSKTLITTLVTKSGLARGSHRDEAVDAEVTLDDLF